MTNAIQRLRELDPPPREPVGAGTSTAWKELEGQLGLRLPKDFMELVDSYGTGYWYGCELRVYNPFAQTPCLNLLKQCGEQIDAESTTLGMEREFRAFLKEQQSSERYPFPIYPEAGGIIPWATTGNGGRLCWLSEGNPDAWPTVYWPDRAVSEFTVYELTATEIILAMFKGDFELYPGQSRMTQTEIDEMNESEETPIRLYFTPLEP